MKVCTAQEPRSGIKKAITRFPPKAAMIGSFGPTGPKFVTYSSAAAGVTPAMKSAAQATIVERSSWTIELVSFRFRPIRSESVAAMHNLIPHCSEKFVLQCRTTGRSLMEFKGGRVRLGRHEGHARRHTYTGKGRTRR